MLVVAFVRCTLVAHESRPCKPDGKELKALLKGLKGHLPRNTQDEQGRPLRKNEYCETTRRNRCHTCRILVYLTYMARSLLPSVRVLLAGGHPDLKTATLSRQAAVAAAAGLGGHA